MVWGLLRTLFLILLGYYVIRWIARVQARKQYREEQKRNAGSRPSGSSTKKDINSDTLGEYVDYEEVK